MSTERAGALSLILGAVAFIALMAVHPSHADMAPVLGNLTLSAIVHGVALTVQPILLFGFWALTRWPGDRWLALIAFCFYALSAILTILAATMSGLILPQIMGAAHHAQGAMMGRAMDPHSLQALANYSVWLNRALAALNFVYFAIAMLLWSLGWSRAGVLGWIVRVAGVLGGGGIIVWAVSGTMTLDAQQGALVLTLVQMGWTLLAASAMLMHRDTQAASA
jgi:hypothetical protein